MPPTQSPIRMSLLIMVGSLGLTACQNRPTGDVADTGPDYSRELRPGESALRRVTDPARMPDLATAWDRMQGYDEYLLSALQESMRWFDAPSSHQFFPMRADDGDITHEQAVASVAAFRELVEYSPSQSAFITELQQRFDVYESVGWNNEGTVLFTGYYAPVFDASRSRSSRFSVPLYTRPPDLVTDPVTGQPLGRETPDGRVVTYPTRREIERSAMFTGNELVWLEDELSAYIVHVNGSARLRMDDGSTVHVGYAGKTDRQYTGLGASMVQEGLVGPNELTLTAIKSYFKRDPQTVIDLIYRNENYVFFTEYDESTWPSGSLGVQVTEEASLATDKKIYPRGGVVLVDTEAVTFSSSSRRFLQFMLDQDTGGAIRAPGRADIFMGTGETAEILAGGQYAEGRLYYLFLKPDQVVASDPTRGRRSSR